jgi:WD40 repeat protein
MLAFRLSYFAPRRPIRVCRAHIIALSFLAASSLGAHAQPVEPTASDLLRKKMREEAAAFKPAPRPPVTESRALSSDGKVAVSLSSTGTMTLWDVASGKDLHTIQAFDATESLSSYDTAVFSPNAALLFAVGKVKSDAPNATAHVTIINEAGATTESSQGGVWDVKTGKLLWAVPGTGDNAVSSGSINTATFSPDGKTLAIKARYSPIQLWDAQTGKLLRTLRVPFMVMDALAFSPDGKTLAGGGYHSTSYSSEIVLWDVESGDLQRSLKHSDNTISTEILSIAFSPDGKLLAAGGGVGRHEKLTDISARFNTQFGMAQLWDVKSGILLSEIGRPLHRQLVTKLAFSPDGTQLAAGSLDQIVGLWDTRTCLPLGNATNYGTEEKADAANNDRPKISGAGVRALAFSPDGKTLNILSNDRSVRAWDISLPKPSSDPIRRVLPLGNARYSAIAFAPNSRSFVSGEHGKQLRFWEVDTRLESDTVLAHNDAVGELAFAPPAPDEPQYRSSPSLLATGSNVLQWKKTGLNSASGHTTGFEVKLWNSETHELQRTLNFPNYSLTSLAVSPGGRWVAAAGGILGPPPPGLIAEGGALALVAGPNEAGPADQTQKRTGVVLIWDALTGELKQTLPIRDEIPSDLIFSPDGTMLVGDAGQAGAILWSVVDGTVIRTLDEDRPPPLKPGEVRMSFTNSMSHNQKSLAFTADGTRLARGRKGEVKLWDVEKGTVVTTLSAPEKTENLPWNDILIALTPDGKILSAVTPRQGMIIWDVATGKQLWKSTQRDIEMLDMAPNGKTLLTCTGNEIRLWDISKVEQGIVN